MLKKGELTVDPIKENVCALSVGVIGGKVCSDLDYVEDSGAEVDMNLVMTASGNLIEVQGTAEGSTFSKAELDEMIILGMSCIPQITKAQNEAVVNGSK
jgi:ribonuclease PH